MNVPVLDCKNHQNADREGYDLQVLVCLIHHHSPAEFFQELMINYLCH